MRRVIPLPIDDVLPDVVAYLRKGPNLVLVAPPGAGKTTRLPSALIDQDVIEAGERVLVLEPRRRASRIAAKRIAEARLVRLGDEVGYQIRFEDRTSK
ncbi:MAG: ATP-dependent helicase HrpB, partial [Myxococcota bacterium]